jgi:hypothetical protein
MIKIEEKKKKLKREKGTYLSKRLESTIENFFTIKVYIYLSHMKSMLDEIKYICIVN